MKSVNLRAHSSGKLFIWGHGPKHTASANRDEARRYREGMHSISQVTEYQIEQALARHKARKAATV